jgi:16S rRNA (uracil1498-N3)-methyltransferase
MAMRLFVDSPLSPGDRALSAGAARHAQVRRVQPGDALWLFDGSGTDWSAQVLRVGRSEVVVRVDGAASVHNELPCEVTLAVGMPANERMDTLVEKATELGVARLQPLMCERSVLRLNGERAGRKVAHWQAIAVAACEQSGRARVPAVAPAMFLQEWLRTALPEQRLLLSVRSTATPLRERRLYPNALCALSGPEGGLSPAEEAAARSAGFIDTGLGPRVLRADTAPLVLLAWVGLMQNY